MINRQDYNACINFQFNDRSVCSLPFLAALNGAILDIKQVGIWLSHVV
jgi:hypothetical protein